MKPYEAAFPVGMRVRIQPRDELKKFKNEWKYHNPLTTAQIEYGGTVATVAEVGFYHGGDALYRLEGLPGMWHEQCLLDGSER